MLRRLPMMLLALSVLNSVVAHAAEKFENYIEKIEGTLVSFEMIAVPAGDFEFAIGEDRPRRVEVKRFWMGRTEVTWDQFDVYWLALDVPESERPKEIDARTGPSGKPYADPSLDFGRVEHPAINMTYHHARAYCAWLSRKTGRKYRLPAEVEWEYAARARRNGTALTREELDSIAWHRRNSATETHPDGKTHVAGKKGPNAWGLHDMLGNVWEWCTTADGEPVARGASWEQEPQRIHFRARFTNLARWSITDPTEPKGKFWLSDGRSAGFRLLREE